MALQVGGLLPGGLRVRGISGGEKRRLSIACGIVGAPELIFLDEPTSGSAESSCHQTLTISIEVVKTDCVSLCRPRHKLGIDSHAVHPCSSGRGAHRSVVDSSASRTDLGVVRQCRSAGRGSHSVLWADRWGRWNDMSVWVA